MMDCGSPLLDRRLSCDFAPLTDHAVTDYRAVMGGYDERLLFLT